MTRIFEGHSRTRRRVAVLALTTALGCIGVAAPSASASAAPVHAGVAQAALAGPRTTSYQTLDAVSSDDQGDAWAVGLQSEGTSENALTMHWNGHRWVTVAIPSGTTGSYLKGVDVVSADDVWAVGFAGPFTTGQRDTLIFHWNGTSWRRVHAPSANANSELFAVRAVARDDVWAVGSRGDKTLVEHWDGSRWSMVASPAPPPSGGSSELTSLTVVSSTDIWAGGTIFGAVGEHSYAQHSLIDHWDGTAWTQASRPAMGHPGSMMLGIAASSSSDVWAVGYQHRANGAEVPLVEQWDGSTWAQVAMPQHHGWLAAVTVVSADDVWAVGASENASDSGSRSVIDHWDGVAWSRVPSPDPGIFTILYGVVATSSTDAWAVGVYNHYAVPGAFLPLALRWDGMRWRRAPVQ